MVLWEYGLMKTTLELPDELMRRIKLRAVQRSQKLKEANAQLLELGMAAAPQSDIPPRPPKPVRWRRGILLTIHNIDTAIDASRE